MFYQHDFIKMISVIVRSYNSAATVKRAMDSALSQTLPKNEYEIIAIDDGSTDGTIEILKSFGDSIKLKLQGHQGSKVAVRRGIAESHGGYVIFLDSDDELVPETLWAMIRAFENPRVDFAYCDYVEKKGEATTTISVKENIFDCIWTNVMFKRELFESVGLPEDDIFFGEYDFLIRLLRAGKMGVHIPQALYIYHRVPGSMTSNKEAVKKGIEQLREKYGDIVNNIRAY